MKPRSTVSVRVNKSLVHSGDALYVIRLDGLDPMLAYAMGSTTGHVTTALWIGGELFVVESTAKDSYWPVNGILFIAHPVTDPLSTLSFVVLLFKDENACSSVLISPRPLVLLVILSSSFAMILQGSKRRLGTCGCNRRMRQTFRFVSAPAFSHVQTYYEPS